ncbi:MAG: hypothetical protein G01um1014106_481, partial [Parcubacteria group bacterium Gr01-1014_106]
MATATLVDQRRTLDPELAVKLCQLMKERYGRGKVDRATEKCRQYGLDPDNAKSVLFGVLAFLGDDYEDYFRWCLRESLSIDLTFQERETLT